MANEKEWQQDISNTVDTHTANLGNHENRIVKNENKLADHEKRINSFETTSDVGKFATRVQAVEDKNTEQDAKLTALTKSVDDNLQTAKQYANTKADDALNKAKTDASQKYYPLSGGKLTKSTICRNVDTEMINIYSGTQFKGASLIMSGKDRPTWNGQFHLCSSDDTHEYRLIGTPQGMLTWDNKNIVRSVNNVNADSNGNVNISSVASATKATQDGNGATIANTYATKTENKNTLNDAKQYANTKADDALSQAKQYANTKADDALSQAKQYANTKADDALNKAKQYANTKADDALNKAKQYANTKADDALNKAKTDASQKYLPLTGGILTGDISRNKSTNRLALFGGDDINNASLYLCGREYKGYETEGSFQVVAKNTNNEHRLTGKPDGTLKWNAKNLVRSVNKVDADNNGNVSLPLPYLPLAGGEMSGSIRNNSSSGLLELFGGDSFNNGAVIQVMGKDYSSYNLNGGIALITVDSKGNRNNRLNLQSDGTLFWRNTEINPVGEVCFFASSSAPSGYLICNGATVSRTTYAKLFSAIGTKYGSGDGSTTFNLPNLINKFAQGSTTVGTVKNAGLPNIAGSFTFNGIENGTVSGAFNSALSVATSFSYGHSSRSSGFKGSVTSDFSASSSNSIYGNSTTVQPPALTLLPCIRY